MWRSIVLTTSLLSLTPQICSALSYSTQDGLFAHHVRQCLELHTRENAGKLPKNWDELNVNLDRFSHLAPTNRYALLSDPVSLPLPYKGDLIVMTRRPYRELEKYMAWIGGTRNRLRETGYRIVYRQAEDHFSQAFVTEEYIRDAFKGRESLLPEPDNEPQRPWITTLQTKTYTERILATIVGIAIVLYLIIRRSKKTLTP